MGKIERQDLKCRLLREAYFRARSQAYADRAPGPLENEYLIKKYGEDLTTRGCSVGHDACTKCDKKVSIILNFARIDKAVDQSGQPVKLFRAVAKGESIRVSEQKCCRDEFQK